MSNPLADMDKPDVIFCIGTNMTECHPVAATALKKAVAAGAKLIVVDPRREATSVDAAGWLGGLAEEIDSNGYGDFVPFAERTDRFAGNWKLLLETFFESYHVFSLHRESLAPQYLGIAASAHGFGPHNRLIVPMKSVLDQQGRLAEDRDLFGIHGPLALQ